MIFFHQIIMLIFKNNIYERTEPGVAGFSRTPDAEYNERFDPRNLIKNSLEEEEELLSFIQRQPKEYWKEDIKKFYPYAYKTGGLPVIRNLLQILGEGLDCPAIWYHMNTYHFCLLFDALARFSFNYNHDNREERIKSLKELRGRPIYFENFVKDYFFNTVFLMEEDKYNALSPEEKKKKGFNCPCQFGVINGLAPTREEMELKESEDYPYSIYV
ncbi:MAG: hypothetical protein V3U37_02710 [Nitrospinaceae bacterium]